MKSKTTSRAEKTTTITISLEDAKEIRDVLNSICELCILAQEADDQSWAILKMMSDKAGPLADDLSEKLGME